MGDVASLRVSWLLETVRDNHRLGVVLAGTWHDFQWLHWPDRVSESVVVVFDVDLAAWHHVEPWLKLLVLWLLRHVKESVDLVSAHFWHLVLVGLGLGVWVIQVHGNDLLRDWVSE